MNYAFLPDLIALTMLVVILLLVRKKHSEERANAWLLGLFITLVEGVAHTFYAPNGMPDPLLHVIVIDCYMVAGLVFVWASSDRSIRRRERVLSIALNAIPLLAFVTPYGLNLRYAGAYLPAAIAGVVVGVTFSVLVRRSWVYAAMQLLGWSAAGWLVSYGLYRNAVYWVLASVYALAAINFYRQLQRHSTGRLAIVTGFTVWSIFFLVHPWVVSQPGMVDLASHMWNLQKALISIGMILVMLEEQATSSAYLAHHDDLTGLPNRRMFASRLSLALEEASRRRTGLAVVVLDLDGFKTINDTYGHMAGDHILREVALVLRKNIRTTDTVARMGGDEFIILADGLAGEASSRRFAEAIRIAVERPVSFHGEPVRVSASVGVALYPEDGHDAIKLLRLADQRMYHRKKAPGNVLSIERPVLSASPRA